MKRYLALLVLFITFQTQASILIEPLVGYQVAGKAEFEGGDSYSGGMGPAFGGRLGYQNLGFQIGVDYLNSTLDMDDKDFKDDLKTGEWGAFVGFEFPILFRVYAGYIFSISGETAARDETSGASLKTDLNGGSGYKAGLGFTLLPFLDINFEYRNITVDSWKIEGSKQDDDFKYGAYMLSLSLPFNL